MLSLKCYSKYTCECHYHRSVLIVLAASCAINHHLNNVYYLLLSLYLPPIYKKINLSIFTKVYEQQRFWKIKSNKSVYYPGYRITLVWITIGQIWKHSVLSDVMIFWRNSWILLAFSPLTFSYDQQLWHVVFPLPLLPVKLLVEENKFFTWHALSLGSLKCIHFNVEQPTEDVTLIAIWETFKTMASFEKLQGYHNGVFRYFGHLGARRCETWTHDISTTKNEPYCTLVYLHLRTQKRIWNGTWNNIPDLYPLHKDDTVTFRW